MLMVSVKTTGSVSVCGQFDHTQLSFRVVFCIIIFIINIFTIVRESWYTRVLINIYPHDQHTPCLKFLLILFIISYAYLNSRGRLIKDSCNKVNKTHSRAIRSHRPNAPMRIHQGLPAAAAAPSVVPSIVCHLGSTYVSTGRLQFRRSKTYGSGGGGGDGGGSRFEKEWFEARLLPSWGT